ncbi:hypothetical protein CASFOL_006006 [Castilleja foliolosa]|uniref:Uncharacterized protein n=1 Tax=Castilleja foliolosa TaxID=1961234 RepID=A0ABD3E550_9LAMI
MEVVVVVSPEFQGGSAGAGGREGEASRLLILFLNFVTPTFSTLAADQSALLRLCQSNEAPPPEVPFWSDLEQPNTEVIYAPQLSASSANNTLSSSIKWRDIFRKNDKKSSPRRTIDIQSEKDIIASFMEMKKREKRNSISGGSVTATTELNINLCPFSRSRSTGNGAARSRSGTSTARNVSSAPCSRSNSTGESKSRSCPGSPGRGGVHVGRSSHVCQVRRGGGGGRRSNEAVVRNIPSGVFFTFSPSTRRVFHIESSAVKFNPDSNGSDFWP